MLMQVEWPVSKMKNGGPMSSAIRERERADKGTKSRPVPVSSSHENLQSPHINYSFFISGIQVLIRIALPLTMGFRPLEMPDTQGCTTLEAAP